MVGAPVLHVNGDDPEAVVFCAELAFDFRQTFKRDVVIDLVCYRRHGHNEADEPAATQPLMYQNIRARKTTRELYADALDGAGVLIDADGVKALVDAYRDKLDGGDVTTELAKVGRRSVRGRLDAVAQGQAVGSRSRPACRASQLDSAGQQRSTRCRPTLTLHPRVAKIYEDRRKMAAGELPMDWGFAENLAYATPARPKAIACAWSARTPVAAPSSTATRCCTTRTPTSTYLPLHAAGQESRARR